MSKLDEGLIEEAKEIRCMQGCSLQEAGNRARRRRVSERLETAQSVDELRDALKMMLNMIPY